jgi:hypothetical protein
LTDRFTWEFTTPRLKVVRISPEPNTQYVAPDVRFLLEFNQPVDPLAVGRRSRIRRPNEIGRDIRLKGSRPGKEEALRLKSWPESPEGHRVVLVPSRRLDHDTAYTLEIDGRLRGTEGPLPMDGAYAPAFRTYGPFRLRSARALGEGGPIILDLSNPVDGDSLVRHLKLSPDVRLEEAWQGSDPANTAVYGDFQPGTLYRIEVTPGLKDLFGQPLDAPASPIHARTGSMTPFLRITPFDAVLERRGARDIGVLLANVDRVRLEMKRLQPLEVLDLKTPHWQEPRPGGPPQWRLDGAIERTLARRSPRDVADTIAVSPDPVLGPGQGGIVAVQVTSLDSIAPPLAGSRLGKARSRPVGSRTLLRVTDLGLTSKLSAENHLVWATSLSTGEPLPGVDLEIYDGAGGVIWRARTDERGLAMGPGVPNPRPSYGSHHLFARYGSDETFLPLGQDWALSPWRFGVSYEEWNPGQDLDGFVYGDRNLYRPGETVHLKAILRRRGFSGLSAPRGVELDIVVSDPRGDEILRTRRAVSRFGTLDVTFDLGRRARPGYHGVALFQRGVSEMRPAASGSFQVAEYKAPEFRVRAEAHRRDYQSGQTMDAGVSAEYLFGAPLARAPVQWVLSRRPFVFHPAGYEGYSFTDWELHPEYTALAGTGRTVLDDLGRASIHPLLDLEQIPVSLTFALEATVMDRTGQASSAETSVTVHRGLVYPGVKVEPYLLRAGQTALAHVVLLGPDGRTAARATGRASLVRREWRTARKLLVGGVVGSETSAVDTTLEVQALPAGPGPHRLQFRIPSAGYYRVVVEAMDGSKNVLKSAGEIYASGSGGYAWGWKPGVELDLVTDKKSYVPGDEAEILVRSPFAEAKALVTVEREGIIGAWTQDVTSTSELVRVPIPREGAAPNVCVSVALVLGSLTREGADPRLRMPEFRMGYANLDVDHSDRILKIGAHPDRAMVEPRDSMTVLLRLTDHAGRGVAGEIGVAVVDEAVLQLLGTTTPDPVARFYRSRGTSVTTSESRTSVRHALSEGRAKGEEVGGGGGLDERYRSLFATTAYWNPSVHADSTGRARVGFKLPDNLTTYRVMCVAMDERDRFGSSDTTFTVTKRLLVQPAIPRFARAGDEFLVGAIVHNRTDEPMLVQVFGSLEGLATDRALTSEARVPARDSRRVDFQVLAPRPGTGRVRLEGLSGPLADGVALSLPVELLAERRTEATAGTFSDSLREAVRVPARAFPDSSRLMLTVSASLLGGLPACWDYLRDYPYGCLEQVATAEWSKILAARLFRTEPVLDAAQNAVSRLSAYQSLEGGFSLWPGYDRPSPFLTAYALLVLSEAARAGADARSITEPALRSLDWQLELAGPDSAARLNRASDWTMALWAMAEAGHEETPSPRRMSALDFLVAARSKLSVTERLYLSLAWQGIREGQTTQRLILDEFDNSVEQISDLAWLSDPSPRGFDHSWYSRERVNGLYLLASIRSGRRSPLEPKVVRWLLEQRQHGRWGSTQDNVMALLGLSEYQIAYESRDPQLILHVNYGAQVVDPIQITDYRQGPSSWVWSAGGSGSSELLQMRITGRGELHYTAALDYLEPAMGAQPLEAGLSLVRSYERFDAEKSAGAPRRFGQGDLVLVRLTLVTGEEADYLVVADPLPAGLEPVHLGFLTTGRSLWHRLHGAERGQTDRARFPASFDEQRDREVRAYADHVDPGVYEYKYLARAVTPGRFSAPPARAELMYHPEVVALTDGLLVEILPR